jgi:hypothetical protein
MEWQKTKRIKNMAVDGMPFQLACRFNPVTFFIGFLNA